MYRIICTTLCLAGFFAQNVWAAKEFIYCSEGSPSIFNPQLASDGATNNATHSIYSRLIDFLPGTTRLMPALAVSWEISKDGKQYTFSLRKNVQFHSSKDFTPTRTFNADDVLFSFNRQRLENHPYHGVGDLPYQYFYSMGLDEIIADIQKVDDYTVRFLLTKPDNTFLAALAMTFSSILSKEYADILSVQDRKTMLDAQPIGTGPFVFQRCTKTQP
ncbi:MAG: ABC transporter substrate-binding protein [Bdellovibrionota bacterium]